MENRTTTQNRYNLTPIIDLLEDYGPASFRKGMMQCYFLIAESLSYNGECAGKETGAALYCLQQLIEALDSITPVEFPPAQTENPAHTENPVHTGNAPGKEYDDIIARLSRIAEREAAILEGKQFKAGGNGKG